MEKYIDYPIGIDLGTTFSCIGVYRNGGVEIIPNEKGDRTTPSVVEFFDDEILVGEEIEYKVLKEQRNKIYAVKRIIGRNFMENEVQADIKTFNFNVVNSNNKIKIKVNRNCKTEEYFPEEISAKVLQKLKKER